MINIQHTNDKDDLGRIHALMQKYFKPYELVSSHEFIYYAENYNKLYNGEDYLVYKIENDDELIGMLSCVKLNEFILVDYFVIDSTYRRFSKDVMNRMIGILKEFKLPIVAEAESEQLCRLYHMFGFKRFNEPYKYFRLNVSLENKTSKVSSYVSNLVYLSSNDMDFNKTKQIIYAKYYMRWNSMYDDELTREYKTALGI